MVYWTEFKASIANALSLPADTPGFTLVQAVKNLAKRVKILAEEHEHLTRQVHVLLTAEANRAMARVGPVDDRELTSLPINHLQLELCSTKFLEELILMEERYALIAPAAMHDKVEAALTALNHELARRQVSG